MVLADEGHHLFSIDEQLEIGLYVKNLDSYDEYSTTVKIDNQYLDKVRKWIEKRKYTCTPIADSNQLRLSINEMFCHVLTKIERDDLEMLKDEYKAMKQLDEAVKREVRLFNFHFFGCWKEGMRERLPTALGANFKKQLVDSMESLYFKVEAIGNIGDNGESRLWVKEPWN